MKQEFKSAWRFLWKSRVSTAIAILTLAVATAIGAVALGAIDATFWRALPFEHGERLLTFYNTRAAAPQFQVLSGPEYRDVQDRLRDAADVAAFVRIIPTLGGDQPVRLQGEIVSNNYFKVLGATAFLGRLPGGRDDDQFAAESAVLSYELWQRRFGGRPDIIGQLIRFDRLDYTVVAVTAPTFQAPAYPSTFWLSLAGASRVFGGRDFLSRPEIPILQTIARPVDGLSPTQVSARVASIRTADADSEWRLMVLPATYLRSWPAYRATLARYLGVFAALAGCVLLVACANLAGLLVVRSVERGRELALRLALGATRTQLLRRLLMESFILTMAGGVLGAIGAYNVAPMVEHAGVPVPARIVLTADPRLLVISALVAATAASLFSVVFATAALKGSVSHTLAATAATIASRSRLQRALVVGQVAVGCMLLIGAGLLMRTLHKVSQIDSGIDAPHTIMGMVGPVQPGAAADPASWFEKLQTNLESTPGVDAAVFEWNASLGQIRANGTFLVGAQTIGARYNVVSRGYFTTLRVPILSGREFSAADRADGEPVAIVNATLAAQMRLGPGQFITAKGEPAARRIVGVVQDTKYNGIVEGPQPFVYVPMPQVFRGDMWLYVKTRTPGIEGTVRRQIAALDPDVALSNVHSVAEQIDNARAQQRTSAEASAAVAGIAVLLALIGLYGVLAASVDRRRREIAIRAAIGATPRDILRGVALEGMRLTIAGTAIGVAVSLVASQVLAGFLYGVAPRDPVAFTVMPLVVLAIATVAWLVPARRAAAIDPASALRD
jgi:predicted permease